MDKIVVFIFILTISLSSACNSGSSEQDTSDVIVEKEKTNMTAINEPGFEMELNIPDEFKATGEPEIFYDDRVGYLKIRSGEDFGIDILEEDVKLEELKTSLTSKPLFDYKFMNETESGFTFQSILPDGKVYSTNFVEKFSVNDKVYYARNSTNGEFSLDKVRKMKEIVRSIKSI